MIILHGFEKNFGLADPSPFVLKVATYMRMADIDYSVNRDAKNLQKAPKGKLPFIVDGDKKIADSQFIIEYLIGKYGDKLDENLTAQQKASAYLISKSLDENLYFCLVYSRWLRDDTWPIIKQAFFGNLPFPINKIVPRMIRKSVSKGLKGQGIGRHSDAELLHITRSSLQALAHLLNDQKYIFGDQPTSIDACCYAFLASFILVDIQNPFNTMAREFDNLVDYCKRINQSYFGSM